MSALAEKRALLERLLRQKAEQPKTAPLSFAQERLWFFDQLAPGSPVYNITRAITLAGPLDPVALARAAAGVVARHEALRTTFRNDTEGPVQFVAPQLDLLLPRVDLSGLPAERRQETATLLSRQAAVRPFDLARGPLLRLTLFRLDAGHHLLLASFHHIVFDGWSFGVFFRELSALYRGLLLPPPLQYPAFARRQRQQLEGPAAEVEIEHWRARLAGAPALLDLPTARPRPAEQSFRGGSAPLALPAEPATGLARLARGASATPFMVHLAVFATLLARWSGGEDLVVGTPVAGRGAPELETLIGFFVNSLALRLDLHGDPPFAEALRRVRETCLDAYSHQELPFERLVGELRPERLLGHSPVFQVMFALQAPQRDGLDLPGVQATVEVVAGRTARLDLLLDLRQEPSGVNGWIEYAADLFDPPDLARLAAHYRILAAGAAADPGCRLLALPLLSPAERHQLSREWNDTGAVGDLSTLDRLFVAQAARTPDDTALIAGEERLTYGDLGRRSERLARRLAALGVGPEVAVALFLPRTADLVVALLATLRAGGFYVPLDPAYPAERLAYLVADSGAAVLLTHQDLAARAPAGAVRRLLIDEEKKGDPGLLPLRAAAPENLAYLVYTSGSTGRPKAVAISHGSAALLVRWAQGVFTPRELTRVLASTSLSFDLSIFELFVPLASGGAVVLAENALAFPDLPARGEVTLINTVPAVLAELLQLAPLPTSIRTVNLAGEALPRALADQVHGAPGVERLYNLYGPSEDTTYSTFARVERRSERAPAIGRPIAGTAAHVLGRGGEPLPPGVPGELWLGGGGLARGYLGRPERTAERFLPDPFSGRPGARLYRTGDLVRFRQTGELEYLGRLDHQVKVRGFRVELGEVEAALRRHPGVAAAAAALRDDRAAGTARRLVGYVVPRAGEREGEVLASLRSFLAPLLPEPMIPTAFVALSALPVNAHGKVDRAALPAPEAPTAAAEFVAPRDPVEEALAGLWAELLGCERIGVLDDFFALGGHSLLATRVLARVRRLFAVDVGVRALFADPTVAGLAREVERARAAASGVDPALLRIPRAARGEGVELPASSGQQRLWFLDRLQPGSALYNMPMAYRLRGGWEPGLLAAGLAAVVERHEALRTTFAESAHGPLQVIAPATPAGTELCQVDLSGLPGPRREAEGERLLRAEARRPFDLVRGPLLRPFLLRFSGAEQVLLLAMHHAVSDGWSMGILRRELLALYGALAEEPRVAPALPELAVQYADFALWQRQWLGGPLAAAQLGYWRERLAGHPPVLALPADRPRPAVQSFRGAQERFRLGAETGAALAALCRQRGASLFMVALAGWKALLARSTGQEDLLVGVPSAGRTRLELEGVIGFFVNTLVLRTDLSGDPSFADLVGRVRESALSAYAHGELPLERLVEELSPERSLSYSPLFQVAFDFAAAAPAGAPLPEGLVWEELRLPMGVAKFDLTLGLAESASGLTGVLEYSLDLFERTTAGRMAGHLKTLLAAAARHPELRLSALPLLSAGERAQALWEWNDTAQPELPAESATIDRMFAAQVVRAPEARALVVGEEQLSYGELNRRANRLAHRLRALGVGPNDVVGLCLDRSPDLVVAILAVAKAGGAFLPLDPHHPPERRTALLTDSRASLLLTERRLAAGLSPGEPAGWRSLFLAEEREVLAGLPAGDPAAPPDGSRLAYVIYTSGSTGKPKGVQVEHRNLAAMLHASASAFALAADDAILALAPVVFDISVFEILLPLGIGATTVLAQLGPVPDLGQLVHLLGRVTRFHAVPALMQQIADRLREEGEGARPRQLRTLWSGGEAVPASLLAALRRLFPEAEVQVLYGPTEATILATSYAAPRGEGPLRSSLLGRGLPGVALRLYQRGQVVPIGVPGEIYIGGAGVTRGYLGRDELTAERFPEIDGSRWYRSGDLARWLADGNLEFLGRADDQVKVRGFRVEPGEIEAVLTRHPAVKEAVVLALPDAAGDRRLVAYLTAAAPPDLDALRADLRSKLPEYMVPSVFVPLPELPLTSNGKVDRKALARIDLGEAGGEEGGGMAPRTPVEEALAGLWSELLGRERIGVLDDFFALGGHSLLATRVLARVRRMFGVELDVRAFFAASTVAALAGEVERARAAASGVDDPALLRIPRAARGEGVELPASSGQQRLWFLDRLQPGSALYNMPMAYRLRGGWEPGLLAAGLAVMVERHEALRTTFAESAEGPLQVISPAAGPELCQVDLSGLPGPRREGEGEGLLRAEAGRPFDLVRGPLLRPFLLRFSGAEQVLLLAMHHAVSDGWSMGILRRELLAVYGALAEEPRIAPSLPELAVQYADFALWQRQWLGGPLVAAQLAYWRERLAGHPPVLALPADRPRPAVQSFRGAQERLRLGAETSAALTALCRQRGASLFMVALAGFKALLARSTGQEDLLVGVPSAGRTRLELEGLIGFFVNTLVLRTDLSGDPSFADLVERVRESALGAYAHGELPLERLVEELSPERSLSYSPLFQVVFDLAVAAPAGAPLPEGLVWEELKLPLGVAKFDLTLVLAESAEGLTGVLEYSLDLFERTTARRLVGHLMTLLAAAARHPEVRLSALPLLAAGERAQALWEWNDTARSWPDLLVPEMLDRAAALRPDALAVVASGLRLSYGELLARADRLARRLRSLGVGPEVPVVVCAKRSAERVVGVVAILRASGVFVSVDPAWPRELLATVLAEVAAPVVLAEERLAAGLPAGVPVIFLDRLNGIDGAGAPLPASSLTPESLAYVIYTSGSTGRPKGVAVPHAGLANLVRWHQTAFALTAEDHGTQVAGPAFDAWIWELWPLLAAGATVHIPDEETRISARRTVRFWADEGLTLPYLPTPLAEQVLEEGVPPGLRLAARALYIGGDRLHRRPDPALTFRLTNHYGPAEYSVVTTEVTVAPEGEEERVPTIGRAIPNTQMYVLDAGLGPLPPGVLGELSIGGVGLARGYLRRPDVTAERFVPDPWGALHGTPGARMYRTGDLVRRLPDGDLEFVGRADHQVKLRGMRVELGEIEATLARHPAVGAAVVLLREDRPSDRRLAAYVVPAEATEVTTAELSFFLEEHLPAHMVPQDWVLLAALPLTVNGKVDRRALPAPERQEAGGTAPRTPLEEVLAGIFCSVLKRERVGIEDDFFALGGHSLSATQVVARVRDALTLELPLRALFEAPTIAGLASRIEAERRREGVEPATPPLVPRVRRPGEILPLSFAQQRLWFIDRLEPGSPLYNVAGAFRLAGALDAAALGGALAEIVRRHEALRTTFATSEGTEGEPVQVVAPAGPVPVPVTAGLWRIDLGALPEPRRGAELRRLAAAEAVRPFDLAEGPLLRTTLVRLAAEEHALFLSVHHVVSDGWSMGVLLRELAGLYAAARAGRPSPLPELPLQYADFALWQRGWLHGPRLETEIDHWRRRLAGAPPVLELPTDRPRPAVQSFRGGYLPARFPPARAAAVAALSRELSATPFMVLLAAFQALLGRYTRQADVAVGSPIAHRTHRELEELIGFFVNTLVLRTDLSGDPSFAALVGRVREVALEAHAHQGVPFERLVEALEPERSLSHTPLFQVMFMLQNLEVDFRLPGLSVTPLAVERRTAKFDLLLGLWPTEEGLGGGIEYSSDLFDPTTAERILRHFDRLLESALAAPETALGALAFLAPAERAQLLAEWNDTAAPPAPVERLHDFFLREARRTPDRVALVFGAEQLTYGALAARTARLAGALACQGVGPEVPVGISAARSLALIEGLLAIFRAGGYAVPLDPTYPAERLAFMLADSAAPVLLADAGSLALLPPFGGALLRLDDPGLPARLAAATVAAAPAGPHAENLAYVIYTSGSTGRPKGIAMPHRAIANIIEYQRRRSGPAAARTLQFSPLSFDVCFQELFSTWAVGGTVVLLHEAERRDALALLRVLERHEVQRLFVPFVALMNLIELADEESAVPKALQEVVTAGEQLRVSDRLAAWFSRMAHCRLENQYGPSEAHVVTTFALSGPPASWAALPPVGRPVRRTRVHVLDARLEPVPIGVPGEVHVGGIQVARGYLSRPDVTAERFLPDPWTTEPGGRLYRTGDLARALPGGDLEFLGRVDFQVKVRGFRIELGEIEAVLAAHEAVAAVVVEAPEIAGLRRLVAYVVPGTAQARETPGPLGAELRRFLAERLPGYMVPAHFMVLDALPVAATGKVDRRALPLPERLEDEGYVAPRTPLEEQVTAIWAEVLGVARVGIHDNFWDLGGHSLLATQVLSRLRRGFGVELPLRTFFAQPTVAELAVAVAEEVAGAGRPAAALEPIRRRPIAAGAAPPPLSFAQERLWFLSRLAPSSLYNMPIPLRVTGRLDVAALAGSLGEIVRRHEALRTTFVESAAGMGQAVQAIAPPAQDTAFPLPLVDLAGLPGAIRQGEARRLAAAESARPLDLERGPLLFARLFRLGATEHLLLLVLHHIVADGWSVGVLLRELSLLYAAFTAGRPSPLFALPIQYADFAVWQRAHLSGERLAAQLAYWRERLAGLSPLELPTDRPRPAVQRFRGDHRRLVLGPAATAGLRALARDHQTSLYTVLLSGFAAFLGRLAGADDLAVGTLIANRNRQEIEPLIGLFVNTLAMRADLSGDPPFVGLLARMREATLSADAHQDLPFERLVEELRPVRDPGRNPLVEAVFALQNAPLAEPLAGGVRFELSGVENRTARFDLWVSLWERGDGLQGTLEHDTDLFSAATAERWAGAFTRLLAAVAARPAAPLSALPLLSPAERHQLLHEWNDTGSQEESATLDRQLAAQAARTPEATALVVGEARLSYGELARRADRLARRLAALGVGPEVPVALFLPRTADLVIALVATLQAGGFYLPLDPTHPDERLAYLLADSGAALLLTDRELQERAPEGALRRLLVDGEVEDLPRRAPVPAAPENLAYLLYTSGSTGKPKGVGVPHGALTRFLAAMRRQPGLTSADVLLSVTTISFDIAALEIFLPLLVGAQVVLVDRATAADGELLAAALARSGATVLQATPATWQLLVEAGWRGERLRALSGGEALPVALAGSLLARAGALWNLYGPTETTVWSAVRPIAAPEEAASIGRPIGATRIHLGTQASEPVPIGVAGELWIGGAGVARGYRGRPELTAERFVPDPFAAEPGARLYRTGDLARFRPDGAIEFLGRLDHQIKLRGFRVEPGEIEAALIACPGVGAAAVLARSDGPGGLRLVAYVAPEGLSVAALRAALEERLPSYMVPSGWVVLPALPRTANGKLDRRALPAPDWGHLAAAEGFVAPSGAVEETIARLWAEVLPVAAAEVGARDDFFTLGGHSLLATQVLSRLRRAFTVELSLRAFFERPTVAGLARAVEAELALAGRAAATLAPIPRRPAGSGPPPLSFAQEQLWFLAHVVGPSPFYNLPVALRLSGRLDVRALAATLHEVVRRHEVLRTTFPESGEAGQAVQAIAASVQVPLPFVDLSALPGAAREAEGRRLAAVEAARPFDLAAGPLLFARLFRRSAEEHLLLVVLHHIVADAWSIGVLLRELSRLYPYFAAGALGPSPLPELPIQYADFAVWQRGRLAAERLEGQLAYWRERLAGLSPLELPTDRPRPPVQRFRGAHRRLAVGPAETAALRALARGEGTALYTVLLSGFAALLSRLARQEDLAIGSFVANRHREEVEPLVGLFVNTLVLRADLAGDPPFAALLGRMRETTLAADAHQDLPFERLVEELNPVRDASRNPLVQVVFSLLNTPLPEPAAAGVRFELAAVENRSSRFDLLLSLHEQGDGLVGALEYDTDLFAASTAERWAGAFTRLLAAVAARPEAPLSALPLLAAAERHQLLQEWNDTEVGIEVATLDRPFAAQAARTPEAVALVVGEARLSYGELARRADRLARRLAAHGVGPEVAVALFLPRTADLVVALLATLSAGGHYVPLDPTYPAERLAYVLADSGAALLVTDRELLERAPAGAIPHLLVDLDVDPRRLPPPVPATPGNLAYLLYTSGSTGKPKGVQVAHRALLNFLASMGRQPGLTGADVLLSVTTISFDIAALEIYLPLLSGAQVVLVDRGTAVDGELLASELLRSAATVLQATPSTWQLLVEAGWRGERLRALSGGEALPAGLAGKLLARAGSLWNLYGPTETTVWSATRPIAAPEEAASIGRPIANTRIHLCDAALSPAPIGVAGELWIGGAGVARGYRGRPDLTAERFIPDPFAAVPGARLYKTGDLARRQPDGAVEFLGRLDHQVKLRGFRIELGEIEAVLSACPGVTAAAVLARAHGADNPTNGNGAEPRLVAYVAPEDLSVTALRNALAERLPDYMVPGAWVLLPALPQTANGKVDRRALPAPDPERRDTAYVAPRNRVEEILAQVSAEVLHLPRVGIEDNFFAIGGDSIRTLQVVARCRERGLRVAPQQMFRHQTIASLAAVLPQLDGELAERLVAVGDFAAPAGAAEDDGFTPADFPRAALTQDELDEILEELG